MVDIAEKDAPLVPKVLPSWLALGAPDVVLAVDEPVSVELREAIERVAKGDPSVRILEVREDRSWKFRMAYVRRSGLRAAMYDRILTGDIDVVVNSACLKAVQLVGEDNVGMVCLEKRRGGGTLGEAVRNASKKTIKVMKRRPYFTGLYALYRPFWLDSEDPEAARSVPSPYQSGRAYLGEDVMMRDAVRKLHKIVYLPIVGGTDLTISFEDRPLIQRKLGATYFVEGRGLPYVLSRSLMYARGQMLGTFMQLKLRKDGAPAALAAAASAPLALIGSAEKAAVRGVGIG